MIIDTVALVVLSAAIIGSAAVAITGCIMAGRADRRAEAEMERWLKSKGGDKD